MSTGTFATAINCMDGRTQAAVAQLIKKMFGVDYVDTITEPGPDKILAENTNQAIIENIKYRVGISVNKHHSKVIAIVAHHDCAGNPVSKEEHLEHLRQAKKIVEGFGFNVEVIWVWVGPDWETAEEVKLLN
jgi:hypothetical protein